MKECPRCEFRVPERPELEHHLVNWHNMLWMQAEREAAAVFPKSTLQDADAAALQAYADQRLVEERARIANLLEDCARKIRDGVAVE